MIVLLLAGCMTNEYLASFEPEERVEVIERLTSANAKRVVPTLIEFIEKSDEYVYDTAAFDALARADVPEAGLYLTKAIEERGTNREYALQALESFKNKRNCDLMATVYLAGSPDSADEVRRLELALSDRSTEQGWPCFQSLKPYVAAEPRAAEIWNKVIRWL